MKNLKEFVGLNVEEKYKYIEEEGVFLMDREVLNKKVFLYYFARIFCEVWFLDLPDHNEKIVADIKLFKSIKFLDPYVQNINLSNIKI